MLPLRDENPSRRVPAITLLLIAVNLAFFLWQLSLGQRLERAFLQLGLIPVRYTDREVAEFFGWYDQAVPFLSSMFLHGGWLHLLGNMWILWIFGDNVEECFGHAWYLGLYLAGGVAAAVVHIVTNPHSQIPTIGASGAVAAVMGAYFRYFPRARVVAVIPPFLLGPYFALPAVLFLGYWFALQFFQGALSLGRPDGFGGVAWWAHVGGFAFGFLAALIAGKPGAPSTRDAD